MTVSETSTRGCANYIFFLELAYKLFAALAENEVDFPALIGRFSRQRLSKRNGPLRSFRFKTTDEHLKVSANVFDSCYLSKFEVSQSTSAEKHPKSLNYLAHQLKGNIKNSNPTPYYV